MVMDKPLRKMSFLALFRTSIFWSKNHSFLSKISNNLSWLVFSQKIEKIWFLDKNHGLSPSENVNVLHFLKVQFSGLKNHSFLSIRSKIIFTNFFSPKKKRRKSLIFGQKPWIIPFGKSRCFALFKTLYCWSKNSSFLSRISKNNIFWLDFPKKHK